MAEGWDSGQSRFRSRVKETNLLLGLLSSISAAVLAGVLKVGHTETFAAVLRPRMCHPFRFFLAMLQPKYVRKNFSKF